jgi:hypothetical protein
MIKENVTQNSKNELKKDKMKYKNPLPGRVAHLDYYKNLKFELLNL